jgi:hypothetical protein
VLGGTDRKSSCHATGNLQCVHHSEVMILLDFLHVSIKEYPPGRLHGVP